MASEDQVDVNSLQAGIQLTQWLKHEVRRVYAIMAESNRECDQRRLAEWVERKGGSVTAREVQQGCRWLKEPGAAKAALDELVKAGRGAWEQSAPGQQGQPTNRFKLSAPSTVYGNGVDSGQNAKTVDVDNVDMVDRTARGRQSYYARSSN